MTNLTNFEKKLVQTDVFNQLDTVSKDIETLQQFSDELTHRTFYERYKGLYKFSNYLLRYFLAFCLAALSLYGWYKLFYFEGFQGILKNGFIALAILMAIGFTFTNEYLRQVIAKRFFTQLYRDRKISLTLLGLLLLCSIVALSTTAYGIHQGITDFSNPPEIGKSKELIVVEESHKIILSDLENLEKQFDNGVVTKWHYMEEGKRLKGERDKATEQLQSLVRGHEDKEVAHNSRFDKGKLYYLIIGVGAGLGVDLFLLVILAWITYYKVQSLKQIDIINNPITSLFNMTSNPLTSLSQNIQQTFLEYEGKSEALQVGEGDYKVNNYREITYSEKHKNDLVKFYSQKLNTYKNKLKNNEGTEQNNKRKIEIYQTEIDNLLNLGK